MALQRPSGLSLALLFLLTMIGLPAATPLAGAAQPAGRAAQAQPRYTLSVSQNGRRPRGAALDGGNLSGAVTIFVAPPQGISRVRFFVDPTPEALQDPLVAGAPYSTDSRSPFELSGPSDAAGDFATGQLANGTHTLAAALDLADGTTQVLVAAFDVYNGPPALRFAPQGQRLRLPQRARAGRALRLITSDNRVVDYRISSSAPWLRLEPGEIAGRRLAPDAPVVQIDTGGLSPGRHEATLSASAEGYAPASQTFAVEVAAAGTCSPLPCEEILVDLPYQLDFSSDHGKIAAGNGLGSGFTYVDPAPKGAGYIPANLTMATAAPGTLDIATTSGIAYLSANAQDNALGVGVAAPNQISVVAASLRSIPDGSGSYEQAGVWFGNDQDNYLKLDVVATPNGPRVEALLEVAGALSGKKTSGAIALSGAIVRLELRANPVDRTIAASYQLGGGAVVALQTFVAPAEFFSFDAAGIDPTIGTRSFAGVYTTQRYASQPLTYSFDSFAVTAGSSTPPPTEQGSGMSFTRSTFALSNPTAMAWGPDNRLYVTEMYGKIHAITLGDSKQVLADQVITALGQRLTLGIAVDPQSTPSNVILWVAHSNPSTSNGELNSSMITRLSGASFATRQDVITGLPRAIANHAINAIHFGPDGRLYIAVGGNTGAGAPNTANTEFGTRAEQPLSAALLVADVRAAGFDGTCAQAEGAYAPAPCSVEVYSSGLRNTYDFTWHSNGQLYATDNGLGVTGTYPPKPAPPCTGYGSTTSWSSDGNNPGEQPDLLLRLEPGRYYGHPNPYRNECVFKDGSYQRVPALATYQAPIYSLGNHKSANGIIEYRAGVFGGALRGELLIANYSVGDDITRIKLSADGRSVVAAQQLIGGFNNPLPLVEGPDGTIYVGEHGAGRVAVLRPNSTGTAPSPTPAAPSPTPAAPSPTPQAANLGAWTTRAALPQAVLDAGGAAVNGRLYLVAGKASTGYLRTLRIYDPAANSWSTGASLPSAYPAVENPAAVAYGGKLYLFGGSTGAFSGATTSAAVYDPANNSWTMLAAMPVGRGGPAAALLGDKIYVVGGMDSSGASLASVSVYDPASNSWGSAPAMQTRRDNPGAAALGGRLYVFGGRTRNADGSTSNGTLSSVEMYDPAGGGWVWRASMPTGRRTMVVGLLNGRALLIGGERTSSGGTFGQNEEYDPLTDSWRALAPMITARHGMVGGTIDGQVYTAGGGPSGGSSYSTVNERFGF